MAQPVSEPVATTFSILAGTSSSRATALLISALDIPVEFLQRSAAEAIIARPFTQPRLELLRRVEFLPESVCEFISRSSAALNVTFRQLLLQGNADTRAVAMRAIRVTLQFQQVEHLLELLARPVAPELDQVIETLRCLVDSLYDLWQNPGVSGRLPGIEAHRASVILAIDQALKSYPSLAYQELVIESLMILGEPNHPSIKQLLWHASEDQRQTAAQLLLSSCHPGVVRLAAESLLEPYPHPKVFEALRIRHDPEFLAAMLRVMSRKRGTQQAHHLKQVQHFDWLEPPFDLLGTLPTGLQPALMAMVNATRVPREIKAGVQEWLLRHGTPEARRAATEGITLIDEIVIQEVVRESLESVDTDVQAWAISQLRQYAIPETFTLLVERLDSPVPAVKDAARAELSGFSARRVLQLADELSVEDALMAGVLLMKVDLDAPIRLRRELSHPARQKRIRAARNVARLGLQLTFLSGYLSLARDTDPVCRRTAAEVLATIPEMEAGRALSQLLDDPHPRVREVAIASVQQWNQVMISSGGDSSPGAADLATATTDW